MKDKIQQILERELAKLDALSATTPEPLRAGDIKSLDTLIKAYRSFSDPAKDPPPPGSPEPGAPPSTEALVNDILDGDSAD